MNYINNSQNETYPKTLIIRNTHGGMIWQIYQLDNQKQVEIISNNATQNGFLGISLEDHMPESKESFPDWRDSKGGKEIIELTTKL